MNIAYNFEILRAHTKHSMAMGNLNRSKETTQMAITALKVTP